MEYFCANYSFPYKLRCALQKTFGEEEKGLSNKSFKIMPLVFLFFFANVAIAAQPTSADIEAQKQKARQEAAERQQREQQKDVFLQKDKKASDDLSLPEETPSFTVNTLRLEGERTESFPWVQDMLDKYAGRKIGMQGINIIVKRINNAVIDRGYITTRVLVPEQDLSKGTLRLMLVPGVIRDIRFHDPQTWGSWRSAFPAGPGDLLNLRNLEQGLEQMKRIPSQDVDMQLVPGGKPGESDIVITVKRDKPWKIVLSLDDSGTKPTGKLQSSQTFSVDNLFSNNDLFNVSFNSDAERERHVLGTRGDSIYYSFPYGNSTFTLSTSSYRYHQTVESGVTFLSSGESRTSEFKMSQLIYRDQEKKTHLEFSIIKNHSKSFIDDTEIEVQRKETTAAKVGLSHRRYFGDITIDALLAYKKGTPWFGAQGDPADQGPDIPTTRYGIWTLDASLSAPVVVGKAKGRYSANLKAQYTDELLYGSDYFSIGNRYTVRGFDGEHTLSAERGWYIRNELGFPIGQTQTEAYLGLDYGQVTGPGARYLSGRILAGMVLGVRGGTPAIQYDAFAGWPLRKPEGFRTATPTFGFQLIYQL